MRKLIALFLLMMVSFAMNTTIALAERNRVSGRVERRVERRWENERPNRPAVRRPRPNLYYHRYNRERPRYEPRREHSPRTRPQRNPARVVHHYHYKNNSITPLEFLGIGAVGAAIAAISSSIAANN